MPSVAVLHALLSLHDYGQGEEDGARLQARLSRTEAELRDAHHGAHVARVARGQADQQVGWATMLRVRAGGGRGA